MRSLAPICLLLIASCLDVSEDPSLEWNAVIAQKRHMQRAPEERGIAAKQRYVDALRRFVARHPDHTRAREVYRVEQLEYATALLEIGRYDEAIVVAENVMDRDGANARATRIRSDAISRRSVAADKLAKLKKGMSESDVSNILGAPRPGWKRELRRQGASVDAWYYMLEDGGTVGVFFRNGKLFSTDGIELPR